METLHELFGVGKDLTALQICCRSFAMFFITLIFIRLGGMRIFGKRSAFDDIIVIMLGAILSRGIVGANSFGATVAAAAVMIAIHRILAFISLKSPSAEKLLKGEKVIVFAKGVLNKKNLLKTMMSQADLEESLRLETNKKNFNDVDTATVETNGRISFVLKNEE